MKKNYILFLLCITTLSLVAQDKISVSGLVTDMKTGEPLIGVVVQVKDKSEGTITDLDGKYTIDVDGNEILVFSLVGLIKQEIKVTSSTLNVTMKEDQVMLEQVVVIGYGSVKKSHLSGAVSSLSSDDMNAAMFTDLGSAIQGKIAGVSVTSSSGDPSSGVNINIRGVNSLVNNNPLYIVDGVIGDFSMVNANDIESMEILKDAASASIYGSRAAAGVVLITTKSGRRDMPAKLDLNISTGMDMIPKKLQMFNGNQYSRWARLHGLSADGYGGAKRDELGMLVEPEFIGKGTDWQDVMYRTAMVYNANATITGGSSTGAYSASFGYLDREGIIRETSSRRFNIRLKSDYSFFNNKFRLGQSLIMVDAKSAGRSDPDRVFTILAAPPTMPVYRESNTLGGWGTTEDSNIMNPVGGVNIFQTTNKNTNVFFNAYAELDIFKNLTYKANLGWRKYNSKGQNHDSAYDLGTYGRNELAKITESSGNTNIWMLENILNYKQKFGDHSIDVLAGYSAQKEDVKSIRVENSKLESSANVISGVPTGGGSAWFQHSLVSLFGRVMYSYRDTYLLSASIRRDGTSRFGNGHQYGNFPSVSVGWNVLEESFAKPLKSFADQIKLRLSYGQLGMEDINEYYPVQGLVYDDMYYLQGGEIWSGRIPESQSQSPSNLTWETTSSYNAGLDLMFLNGKISLSVDAYIKKTKDLLLKVAPPLSSGTEGLSWQNVGNVDNKGIEVSFDYKNSIGDFNYYAGFNLSTLSNKVTKIRVNGEDTDTRISGFMANGYGGDGITMFSKGHSISYFNLIETDGIFQSMEEVRAHVDKNGNMIQPGAVPGDLRYKDYDGDGKITTSDQHDMGSPFPDFDFGIRLGADWKGFDINLFFDGMVGNKVYNYPAWRTESGMFTGGYNFGYRVANSWTEENRNTGIPRFTTASEGLDNKYAYTDRWLEDGSYLRLKNLNIGYSLSPQLLKKVSLQKLRVYASFENLFTISGYNGYTPDVGESSETAVGEYKLLGKGVDHGRYPLPRTITFGLQLAF